jgi:lipopolysaccharide cholinephosphotransferase
VVKLVTIVMETRDLLRERKQTMLIEMAKDMDRVCQDNGLTYAFAYGSALGAVRHQGFIPWDGDIDIVVSIETYKRFCSILKDKLPEDKYYLIFPNDKGYENLFPRLCMVDYDHHSLHIDIFPMAGAPKSKLGKRLFSRISYLVHRCYFVKKVDVNVNYRMKPKKRFVTLLCKTLLRPFPAYFFQWLTNWLSKAFPVDNSIELYNVFCGEPGLVDFLPKSCLDRVEYVEFEGHRFPVPGCVHEYLRKLYGDDYLVPNPDWKW